jgi:hypothetical protein
MTTGYILPSGTAWTLIQVSNTTHYAHVYDGAGTLTTYTDKVAGTPTAHTPSVTAVDIVGTVYNDVTAILNLDAWTLDDTAFNQAQVDADYGDYFVVEILSSMALTNDSSLSMTNYKDILSSVDVSNDMSLSATGYKDIISSMDLQNDSVLSMVASKDILSNMSLLNDFTLSLIQYRDIASSMSMVNTNIISMLGFKYDPDRVIHENYIVNKTPEDYTLNKTPEDYTLNKIDENYIIKA